jgi:predicted transposase YbfD/YdcC
MECNTGKVMDISSIYASFEKLADQRKARGKRYTLATVLLGLFLAKLCGEDKPSGIAEWVKLREKWITKLLGLKREQMPHHNTYRRILAQGIKEEDLERMVREHYRYHGQLGYHVVVAMDGKALRGTIDTPTENGLYLLAVFLPEEGITLAQMAIPDKQNEISAAPKLLEWVDLRNKVVIGDALHTQRQVSIQIGTAGGHYLWTVKGNQPQLLQDIQDWFDPEVKLLPGMGCPPKDFRSATLVNKQHGRTEVRTLTTSSQLNDFIAWPFVQQVFRLERHITIQKTGKIRHEVIHGITSLSAEQAGPEQLLVMLRSYWQIENGLHYRRDVTLHEDTTRWKSHAAAHNMATINNLVLALITKANFHLVPPARRFFAAHPEHALSLIL